MICIKCKNDKNFKVIAKDETKKGIYCSDCGKWIKWGSAREVEEIELKEFNKINKVIELLDTIDCAMVTVMSDEELIREIYGLTKEIRTVLEEM